MMYQGHNIESFQLVSYMGEERKQFTCQENQKYFSEIIDGKISFACSIECPIEDMVCVGLDDVTGEQLTEWEKEALLCGLEELKAVFPNSFVNLYLSGFTKDGNCIDITGEEFRKLYC